jgi:hypothetical protein
VRLQVHDALGEFPKVAITLKMIVQGGLVRKHIVRYIFIDQV